MAQPMPNWEPHHSTEIHEGEAARRRLLRLGLDEELLLGALEEGDRGRQACSAYHPAQAPGQRMWADSTAGLRRGCLVKDGGWSIDRTDNFETTLHRDRSIAIAVMGGDQHTGYRGDGIHHPKVRRKRGPVTTRRVIANSHGTLPLFPAADEDRNANEVEEGPVLDLWLLLVAATPSSIMSELSRPVGFTAPGVVGLWAERILLPAFFTSGGVTPLEEDDGDDDGPILVSDR